MVKLTNYFITRFISQHFLWLLLVLILVTCSCSTHKKSVKSKSSTFEEDRDYSFMQNVTAKYNILYHANLMLQQEQLAVAANKKLNYQTKISVFDEPEAIGDAHPLMDSLIAKAYKIINDKQQSKYTNDAYYAIAQANYLKGSYFNAIAFFDHLIKNIETIDSHYVPLAYAWKSRALLQIGRIKQAKLALDSAVLYQKDYRKTQTFVNAANANYFVKIEEYTQAIHYLEEALAGKPDQQNKYRWTFLLAQLYREQGQSNLARAYYRKVANGNVPFDLAFEAGLQAAYLESEKYDNLEDRIRPLKRLLKEGKNQGYEDQILYEIGKISQADEVLSLDYFKKSLQQNSLNAYQKTETYLTLIDFYFKKAQYNIAQSYVDSVIQILPNDYTDVNKIRRRMSYMSELTNLHHKNLTIDTSLFLYNLDDNERNLTISKYANEILQEKLRTLKQVQTSTKTVNYSTIIANNAFVNNNSANSNYSNDQFYFNNQEAILVGAAAFKSRWGNRQLQDNWRFSSSATPAVSVATNSVATVTTLSNNIDFDEEQFISHQKNNFLLSIPKTPSAKDSLHQQQHQNMISIANIYREYIKEDAEAIAAYEKILLQNPNTSSTAEVYYALYRLYNDRSPNESIAYKNKLIAAYPNSIYAEAATNPNFLDHYKKEKLNLNLAFQELYLLYADEEFDKVLTMADQILRQYPNSKLSSQVDYLKTLAVGRIGTVIDFTTSLQKLTNTYPFDELITPLAKGHLAYLNNNQASLNNQDHALQGFDRSRETFVDEPNMTDWPALRIVGDYRTGIAIEQPEVIKKSIASTENSIKEDKTTLVKDNSLIKVEPLNTNEINIKTEVSTNIAFKELKVGRALSDTTENNFKRIDLLPVLAEYYFVINVDGMNFNLSPSRYGIGQFMRSKFSKTKLIHQLKTIADENQLILVGSFYSLKEAKDFESKFLPMINEIMKIPTENYNTFVVTKENLDTLTDLNKLSQYYQAYIDQ